MQRTPPTNAVDLPLTWGEFNQWADAHGVPTETEDWEYLWECWQSAVEAVTLRQL